MDPFETTEALVAAVEETGASYRVLNRTPMGHPIIDVRTGGDRQPAVLVTAGAHATEQAGVGAAVDLIDRLDTDREVHVIPTRDPIGLDGYEVALARAVDGVVTLSSFGDLEQLLESAADVTHREDDMVLSLIGDVGFATKRPEPAGDSSQLSLLKRLKAIQHAAPDVLEPYRGRRMLVPPGQSGIPGSGDFNRAYTLVVGPDGRLLHLNRFFDTTWAPVETRCTRRVMEEIDPALTFDLHETQLIEDRFYFGVNQHGPDDAWERELARAIRSATAEAGATFAADADVARVGNITIAEPSEETPTEPEGVERLAEGSYLHPDPSAGAEGLNAGHFAARNHGPAVGTETGMWGDFEDRVEILATVVEAGVAALESRRE